MSLSSLSSPSSSSSSASTSDQVTSSSSPSLPASDSFLPSSTPIMSSTNPPPSSSVASSITPSTTTSQSSTMSTSSTSTTSTTTTSSTSTPTSTPPTTSTTSTTSSTTTTTSETTISTTESTTSTSTIPDPTTTTSSDPPETSSTSSFIPEPTSTPDSTPATTFSSVVFITTTDRRGSPTRTAPPQITSTFVSTETNGVVSTVTQIIANPSLAPNNAHSGGSGFFSNTGAVAAVFVLVGLAATSIVLWILFAIRRRRRRNRLENDTALTASQTVTTRRTPLEDDDDPHQARFSASALELSQQRSSSGLASTYFGTRVSYHDDPDHLDGFNPYADLGYPQPMAPGPSKDGYVPTRTGSPPVAFVSNDRSRRPSASGSLGSASGPEGYIMGTHSTTPSGASYEPLMASYYRQSSGSNQYPGTPILATPPATTAPKAQAPSDHSSQPLVDDREPTEPTEAHSVFSSDDRLDPGLRQRQREADSASMKDLRDEEDYSRPVLGVRNLP